MFVYSKGMDLDSPTSFFPTTSFESFSTSFSPISSYTSSFPTSSTVPSPSLGTFSIHLNHTHYSTYYLFIIIVCIRVNDYVTHYTPSVTSSMATTSVSTSSSSSSVSISPIPSSTLIISVGRDGYENSFLSYSISTKDIASRYTQEQYLI